MVHANHAQIVRLDVPTARAARGTTSGGGVVKVRFSGTENECAAAVAALRRVVEVLHVTQSEPGRNDARPVRVFVTVRLRGDHEAATGRRAA